MHKRKILLCITLGEQGGAQSFLLKLAVFLQKKGHEVAIVSGHGEWLKRQCDRQNTPFYLIPSLQREISPIHDWKASKELMRLFKDTRPDAVHLNSTKMGIIGSYAAKKAKVRNVVYRIGGWVFLEQLPAWKKWLYKQLEIKTAMWKDTILCVHPGDAETAKREGIKPKRALLGIPNGINMKQFRDALLSRSDARTKLNIAGRDIVFGTVANFFPPKNLPNYMEACRVVAEKIPGAKFLILGDGREREAIEQKRKEYGLEQSVLLPGAYENASTLLRAFDVFVLPSSKEGMAFALLEAMAAGLPCVATDVGAASYMLENGNCGWLSSHDDMKRLAENMMEAFMSLPDNPKGRRAAIKAERDFPLEKTLEANLDALLR